MWEARGVVRGLAIAMSLTLGLMLVACAGSDRGTASEPQPEPDAEVRQAAADVVAMLNGHDGVALAALAHPEKGVRFSPYAYVDVESDVVLMPSDLERLWEDETVRTWGAEDGTGDPIEATARQYAARFVLDRDYSEALVSVNDDQAEGNTVNNAADAYPDGTRVEYYIEDMEFVGTGPDGEPASGSVGTALRLVFEQVDGEWRLVGVIHDEWTI